MNDLTVVFVGLLLVLFLGVVTLIALALFRPWFQCFLAAAPVSLVTILAMRLRRSPVQLICEQRIKAAQVGVDLPAAQLEQAYLQGADIKKAVDALCLAHRTGREICWEDLVKTDLLPGR